MRSAPILKDAQNAQSKYLALSILEKVIQTRWKALPVNERDGIRNFLAEMCIGWSSDETIFRRQRSLLSKANITLVEIVKQEWPNSWENFVPEIVSASEASYEVCENNMNILKLLAEEVYEFSANQMTGATAKKLKQKLHDDFAKIFELCIKVLQMAPSKHQLIIATLECLASYLSRVPIDMIFSSNLVGILVPNFLAPAEYRNPALKCLTEIAQRKDDGYDGQFYDMFFRTLEVINQLVPLETDLKSVYATANSRDQDFIQNLSLFLITFLGRRLRLVESQGNNAVLLNAHEYLIKISQIDEREVFKACLDYWSWLVFDLFEEMQKIPVSELGPLLSHNYASSFGGGGAPDPDLLRNYPLRKHVYADILSKLRTVAIEKMVRPEEVLIVENDEGEIVREFVKESDTIMLYQSMRKLLVFLTHLDVNDTKQIMMDKLARQIDDSEWSWNNINTLCWAIGSISGAMNEEMEKQFLVSVIKDLLNLTEMKKGKDNKAVVASNIMYIVGQYPRFLRAHWRFLKTVANKLFEFMHETHEGVQDMACDTILKISKDCKRQFIALQQKEVEPFIDEIIANLQGITSDLSPQQVHTFYEACGIIVAAQAAASQRERLLENLMRLPNSAWANMIEGCKANPDMLANSDNVKVVINIIKTNVAVCSALGQKFYSQLGRLYPDMLGLYSMTCQRIVAEGTANELFYKSHQCKTLRSIKKEILKLIEAYISRCTVSNASDGGNAGPESETSDDQLLGQTIAEPLLRTILADYSQNPPIARDAEVLACCNTLVAKLGAGNPDMVVLILQHLFECTLDMIKGTMAEFPEFRLEFFRLLQTINKESFPALLKLPADVFSKTVDACLWAAKHDNREIEEIGLKATLEMIRKAAAEPDTIANQFFQRFFKPIVGDVFFVLTDGDHKASFEVQAEILRSLILLVESNRISAPLYAENEAPAGTSNAQYFRQFLCSSLATAYKHLQESQISTFVEGLFRSQHNPETFIDILRVFLVQIKEVGGEATDYLFAEQRRAEVQKRAEQEREAARRIGGLIKPADLAEDADF